MKKVVSLITPAQRSRIEQEIYFRFGTKTAMAEYYGVSTEIIRRVLTGKSVPRYGVTRQIAIDLEIVPNPQKENKKHETNKKGNQKNRG